MRARSIHLVKRKKQKKTRKLNKNCTNLNENLLKLFFLLLDETREEKIRNPNNQEKKGTIQI